MAVNSIYNSNNNFFNTFFNTSGQNNSGGGMGIFSGASSAIGDMSLIKSGSYKKLLKSYYASQADDIKNSLNGTDEDEKTSATDSTGSLQMAKSDASSLLDSLDGLNTKSLYKNTLDEKGKAVYDTDKISSAVKDYVESYNSFIDSTGDLNSTKLLGNTLDVIKNTKKNAGLLSDIGIKIGKDNKLSFDEEKFKNANMTTVNTLFAGSGSYGASVSSKASSSYRIANTTAFTNNHASSYTYNGAYSYLGTNNNSRLNQYL